MVFTKFVQSGRGVLITRGKYEKKFAIIVDILDLKRSIIEEPINGIERHIINNKNIELTDFLIDGMERGISSEELREKIEKSKILDQWDNHPLAKKIKMMELRNNLTVFQKHIVSCLKNKKRELLKSAFSEKSVV